MKISVPYETTFDCPEGQHRAVLIEVRQLTQTTQDDEIQDVVRLKFEVDLPLANGKKILVAKNFPPSLSSGSPLRAYLESWLGAEFIKKAAGKELDLHELVGKEAIIQVRHVRNTKYKKPFVELQVILPVPPAKAA